MTNVLLLSMPFDSIRRPSIALSLLSKVLQKKGINADIAYVNLQFAKQIGLTLHQVIAEKVPQELLLGDIIFSQAAFGKKFMFEKLHGIKTHVQDLPNRYGSIPSWLFEKLPYLSEQSHIFLDNLIANINFETYNLIGFTCMFNITPSLALSKKIKKDAIRPPHIMIGGSCCQNEMGKTIHESCSWIDFVCNSEGEHTIEMVLEQINAQSFDFQNIPNLVWRHGAESIENESSCNEFVNLNQLPSPDYSTWFSQLNSYKIDIPESELTLPIETSRGCWHGQKSQCLFCGLNGNNINYRAKSYKNVIKDIQNISKYKIKSVYAVDNILNMTFFKNLFPALSKMKLDMNFFFEVKCNLTRKQMQLLKSAGVSWIQPGIESLNSDLLSLMNKGCKSFQNIRILKWACEFGIGVVWNILYGFPGEKGENYKSIVDLIPYIHHLFPPTLGCNKIRIDRFSPLFNSFTKSSLFKIKPFSTYTFAFPFNENQIRNMAYFFENNNNAENIESGREDTLDQLKCSISNWQNMFGQESLTYFDHNETLYIFDYRSIAINKVYKMRGLRRELYLLSENGVTITKAVNALNENENTILEAVNFLENHFLVLNIDHRYLGIAVSMKNNIPNGSPIDILDSLCHVAYCNRMKLYKERVSRGLSLALEEV